MVSGWGKCSGVTQRDSIIAIQLVKDFISRTKKHPWPENTAGRDRWLFSQAINPFS